MRLAYGSVYALTGTLWLVALFHASMNHLPVIVAVTFPFELYLVVSVLEYTVMVSLVYLTVRLSGRDGSQLIGSQREMFASPET